MGSDLGDESEKQILSDKAGIFGPEPLGIFDRYAQDDNLWRQPEDENLWREPVDDRLKKKASGGGRSV
ncbi:MAG: hypothetical protein WA817_17190 [Candidatus Acidiferrum sp.]